MTRIQLGTPQEKELTALVLAKLNDYGWADNDVLANFIVVMIANDKSRDDIITELNDILPGEAPLFAEWLFGAIDNIVDQGAQETSSHPAAPQQAISQDQISNDIPESMELVRKESPVAATSPDLGSLSSRQQRHHHHNSERRAPGRLLQSAISSATRSESSPPISTSSLRHREAPSRIYEDDSRGRERRHESPRRPATSRGMSSSPVRSREGLTTGRGKEERIRFRRTSAERAQDEARINARLGIKGGRGGGGGGSGDRLKGRLGNIDSRLGWRDNHTDNDDTRRVRSRERSWDTNNDYHDRRDRQNKNNSNSKRTDRDALRDIERRLGTRTRPLHDDSDTDGYNNNSDIPSQPASWSRDPEKMLRVEAEITRRAVDAAIANKTRCRFWPSCSQGDACHYWHPRELCAEFPNCPKTADTCLYIHPLAEPTAEQVAAAARQALVQSMKARSPKSEIGNSNNNLMNGAGGDDSSALITNALQMPFALGSTTLQECKFGARCTRSDCKFRHPQGGDPSQPLCRFFPNCTKPNCPFFHPPYGEPLAAKDVSMDESGSTNGEGVNRIPTACRFGDQCTRPGCHFTHPRDGTGTVAAKSNMPMCKFNPCTRPGCPFRHLAGGSGAPNRTLVLNKSTNNTSERFASGIVADGEVEKLYVPASSHWANGGVSHQPQQQSLDSEQQLQQDNAAIQAEMDMDMDIIV